jgi:single-strand DNA-binding protein
MGRRTATGGLEDADMINDSHIDLAGFVASEPAFKRIAGGTSTAKLRVAYTERRFNRETGEWADGPTSFVTVMCWRTLADNVAVCLRKGEPVLVRGRLRVREYEGKEGSPRIAVEIEASSVGHDLSRGVAHFSRTRRAPGETAAENAEALAAVQSQDGDERADGDEPGLPGEPTGEGPAGDEDAGGNRAGRSGAGQSGTGQSGTVRGGAGGKRVGRKGVRGNGAEENGAEENGDGGNGAGDGVLDERAVAELATELTKTAGEVAV